MSNEFSGSEIEVHEINPSEVKRIFYMLESLSVWLYQELYVKRVDIKKESFLIELRRRNLEEGDVEEENLREIYLRYAELESKAISEEGDYRAIFREGIMIRLEFLISAMSLFEGGFEELLVEAADDTSSIE